MFNQELQLKSRMLRVTSCDQLRLAKLDFLSDTNFQILVRKFLPFATIVSLAIFSRGTRAQHLTLCGVCVCGVWCPLDGCDDLIGQRGETISSVYQYMCTHSHGHTVVMNRTRILA